VPQKSSVVGDRIAQLSHQGLVRIVELDFVVERHGRARGTCEMLGHGPSSRMGWTSHVWAALVCNHICLPTILDGAWVSDLNSVGVHFTRDFDQEEQANVAQTHLEHWETCISSRLHANVSKAIDALEETASLP
jgi:hypothetical protein